MTAPLSDIARGRAERKAARAARKRLARWQAIARIEWQREQPKGAGPWIEHMRADKARWRFAPSWRDTFSADSAYPPPAL